MESPVIVENYTSYPDNNTGFPFDDRDYDSNDRLRSTLDDIAQRHPEFADSLNFDFPSLRRKRFGSGSSSTDENRSEKPQNQAQNAQKPGQSSRSFDIPERSRFGDHTFPSGFNRFPFTRHFDEFDEDLSAEKPPEIPRESREVNKRPVKKVPNPNLPQHLSNTVDLGQKQEPVEENRSQRSMSAPPENRTFRKSSERDMGGYMSSNASNKPRERIIPIHVEGRDEPIIPKNVNFEKSESHEPMRQTPPPAQHFQQAPPSAQNYQQAPSQRTQATPPKAQAPPSKAQSPPTRDTTPPSAQQKQQTPPPTVNKNDPLEKIKSVKSEVLNLMEQVEMFTGTRKDKLYGYLDEMLTVNLLKLDNIETEGKDNIRTARKEAIKCIQECIAKLESKAQQNEKTDSESQNVSVTKTDSQSSVTESKSNEPDSKPKFRSTASIELTVPNVNMEIDSQSENAQERMEVENPATEVSNAENTQQENQNVTESVTVAANENSTGADSNVNLNASQSNDTTISK